jgi:hypothetical protein
VIFLKKGNDLRGYQVLGVVHRRCAFDIVSLWLRYFKTRSTFFCGF